MKKTILLNLDEKLFENMEKYRQSSGMNKQEFIRTAIWTMCLGLETKRLEKEFENKCYNKTKGGENNMHETFD